MIVSSGAIALGQNYLRIKKKKIKLEMSQAIAAVGQIHLAGEFQKSQHTTGVNYFLAKIKR